MGKELIATNGNIKGKECIGQNPSFAVGILIYNPDIDSIWMVIEKTSKAASGKTSGQLSIPIETKKIGESELAAVYGGLSEFCRDKDIPSLSGHLYRVNTENGYRRSCMVFPYKGVGLPVDLALIISDSAQISPTSSCDEVETLGWVSLDKALKTPNVRSVSQELLEVAVKDRMIEKAMADFRNPQARKLVFPNKNFSIEMYSVIRELKTDMTAMIESPSAENSQATDLVEARSQG